jgi:hypothetical protein
MTHRNAGAASALTLALAASFFAATNFGAALIAKRSPSLSAAPVVAADPVAPLLDLIRAAAADPAKAAAVRQAKGEFARFATQLATIAANDDDARQAEAIAALGIAGTPEAVAALRDVVQHGSPVDAELALAALGNSAQPCAAP